MARNDDLTNFVRDALSRGESRERIREVLLEAGWSADEVRSTLLSFADLSFPIAVPRPRPSTSAREAFEYLVLFGTLYFAAFSLGRLLFQFINLAFPDPLWQPWQSQGIRTAIRLSIASLVVSTPVFLWTAWSNSRAVAGSPLKRASPVRRWLTYLTLAVAAGLLIGDATGLVYGFLGGEATPRFLLKSATVGAIAGAAFVYYLSDLRRDETEDVEP
jgi:hypothetical protein